ncbi:ankyrin-3 [Elysia marginata]|uniref:Ankyrin-3 n=1 Tax=Elysia marginata TaxID=1093978 RepID=A0AAV4GFR9_9GAST|nr:ankyrin-3 [Elysia marginata]
MAAGEGLKSKGLWDDDALPAGKTDSHDENLCLMISDTQSPNGLDGAGADLVADSHIMERFSPENPETEALTRCSSPGSNPQAVKKVKGLNTAVLMRLTSGHVIPSDSSSSDLLDDITSVIAVDTGQFLTKHFEKGDPGQAEHCLPGSENTIKTVVSGIAQPLTNGDASHLIDISNKRSKSKGYDTISNNGNDDNNNAVGCNTKYSPLLHARSGCNTSKETTDMMCDKSSRVPIKSKDINATTNSHEPGNHLKTVSAEIASQLEPNSFTDDCQPQNPPCVRPSPQVTEKVVTEEHRSRSSNLGSSQIPLSLVEKTEKMSLEDDLPLLANNGGDNKICFQSTESHKRSNGWRSVSPAPRSACHQRQLSPLPSADYAPMSCDSNLSSSVSITNKSPASLGGQTPGQAKGVEASASDQTADVSSFTRQMSSASQAVSSADTLSSSGRGSRPVSSDSTLEPRGGDDATYPEMGERNSTPGAEHDDDVDPDSISIDGEGEYEDELCRLELLDESYKSWDDLGEDELRSKGRGRKKTVKVRKPDKPRRIMPRVHDVGQRNQIPDNLVREFLSKSGLSHLKDSDHLPDEIPVTIEPAGPNLVELRLCTLAQTIYPPTLPLTSACGSSNRRVSPNTISPSGRTPSPVNNKRSSQSSSWGRPVTAAAKTAPSSSANANNIPILEKLMPVQVTSSASAASRAMQRSTDSLWNCPRQPRVPSPTPSGLSPAETRVSVVSPSHASQSVATQSTALTNDTRSSCGNLSNLYSPQAPAVSPPPTSQEVSVVQYPTILNSTTQSIQLDGPIWSWRGLHSRPEPYSRIQQQQQPLTLEQLGLQLGQAVFLPPSNPPSFQQNPNNNHNFAISSNSCETGNNGTNADSACQANAMPFGPGNLDDDFDWLFHPKDNTEQFQIANCIGPEAFQTPTTVHGLQQEKHNQPPFMSGHPYSTAIPEGSGPANAHSSANGNFVHKSRQAQQTSHKLDDCANGLSPLLPTSNGRGDMFVPSTVIGLSGTPVSVEKSTKRKVPVKKCNPPNTAASHKASILPSSSISSKQDKSQIKEIYLSPTGQANLIDPSSASSFFQSNTPFSSAKDYAHQVVLEPNQDHLLTYIDKPQQHAHIPDVYNVLRSQTGNQNPLRQPQVASFTTPSQKLVSTQTPHQQQCSDANMPTGFSQPSVIRPNQSLSSAERFQMVQTWLNNNSAKSYPSVHAKCPEENVNGDAGMTEEQHSKSAQANQISSVQALYNSQLLCNGFDISAYISSLDSLDRLRGKKNSLDEYMHSNSVGMESGSGDLSFLQELGLVERTRLLNPNPAQATDDSNALDLLQQSSQRNSPPPLTMLSHKDVTDVLNSRNKQLESNSNCPPFGEVKVSQIPPRVSPSHFLANTSTAYDKSLAKPQHVHNSTLFTVVTTTTHQYSTATQSQDTRGIRQTPISIPPRDSQSFVTANHISMSTKALPSNRAIVETGPSFEAVPSFQDSSIITPGISQNGVRFTGSTIQQNPTTHHPMEAFEPCGPPSDIEMKSSSLTDMLPVPAGQKVYGMGKSMQDEQKVFLQGAQDFGNITCCFPPLDDALVSHHHQQPVSQAQQNQSQTYQTYIQQPHPHQRANRQPIQFALPKEVSDGDYELESMTFPQPLPNEHVLEWIQQQQNQQHEYHPGQEKQEGHNVISLGNLSETPLLTNHHAHEPVVHWQGQHVHSQQLQYQQQQQQWQQQQQQQQQQPQQTVAPSNMKLTKENLRHFQKSLSQKQLGAHGSVHLKGSTSNISRSSHHLNHAGSALNQCQVSDTGMIDNPFRRNVPSSKCNGLIEPAGVLPHRSSVYASSSQQKLQERSDGRRRAVSPVPSRGRSGRNSSPCPSSHRSVHCSTSPHQPGSRCTHHSPSPSPSSHRSACPSPVPNQAVSKSSRRSPSPRPSSSRSGRHSPSPARRLSHFSEGQRQCSQKQQSHHHGGHPHQHHQCNHHYHQKQHQQSSSRTNRLQPQQQQQLQLQHQNQAYYNLMHTQHQGVPCGTHPNIPEALSDENIIPRGAPDVVKASATNKKNMTHNSSKVHVRKASNSSSVSSSMHGSKSRANTQDKPTGSLRESGPITLSSGSDAGRLSVPGNSDVGNMSMERSASMSSGPENSDLEGETVLHILSQMDIPKEHIPKIAAPYLHLIDDMGKRGETAMFVAVKSGRVDVAEFLLSHKANPNLLCLSYSRGPRVEQTALHEAVLKGDEEMVKLLLATGYNTVIDLVTPSIGMTPLMLALELHNHERNKRNVVTILVKHGASLSAKDSTGKTPLMFAIQSGDIALVEYMLRHTEADTARDLVGMTTNRGNTCLHFAAQLRNVAVEEKRRLLRKLILAGGDPSYRNYEGDSPKDWDRNNIEAVLAGLKRI